MRAWSGGSCIGEGAKAWIWIDVEADSRDVTEPLYAKPPGFIADLLTTTEAAHGGVIALVEQGDQILIDVDSRRIELLVDDEVLAERRAKMDASERPWQPATDRGRILTSALRAYAKLVTSGATGAVRSL